MWLLVGGRGGEIDISAVAKKNSLGATRSWRASMVQVGAMDRRRRSFLRKPDKTVRQDFISHPTRFCLVNCLWYT